MRAILSLLVAVVLAGCASVPRQVIGQFNAHNGEFIVIKRDGQVLWSPLSKTGDRLMFVGIAAPRKDDPYVISLIVPSASPFLDAKLTFSTDFSRLTFDWGRDLSKKERKRATEYERSESL